MSFTYDHLKWLEDTGTILVTECGKEIPILKFSNDVSDFHAMTAWATHFRNHYCSDAQIDFLKNPSKSKSEYLLTEKFPGEKKPPGPSIRAGDFAEILIADYLEFRRNFQVPRTRYERKAISDESTKGSDVIAFKKNHGIISSDDELLIFEVKAKAGENSADNVLQTAINHSVKDEFRLAESLNAMKQRLLDKNDMNGVQLIDRFQREPDHPFKRSYGAAGVFSESSFNLIPFEKTSTLAHPKQKNLELIVIHCKQLMPLIHALYKRAADEA